MNGSFLSWLSTVNIDGNIMFFLDRGRVRERRGGIDLLALKERNIGEAVSHQNTHTCTLADTHACTHMQLVTCLRQSSLNPPSLGYGNP